MVSESEKSQWTKTPSVSLEPAFRGNYTHNIDDKGRVSLPVQFREILEAYAAPTIVLTNYISDGARCLEGFSSRAWAEFEAKLRAKSRFESKIQKLENFYLSRAAECALDKSGRFLLPQHLRSYAGIDRELTFTSSVHGFRLWSKRVWDVVFAQAEAALMENPELFADVDL